MTRYCVGQCRTVEIVIGSHYSGDIEIEALVRLKSRPHTCTNGTYFDGGAPQFEIVSMTPLNGEKVIAYAREKILESAAQKVRLWEYDADPDT